MAVAHLYAPRLQIICHTAKAPDRTIPNLSETAGNVIFRLFVFWLDENCVSDIELDELA